MLMTARLLSKDKIDNAKNKSVNDFTPLIQVY